MLTWRQVTEQHPWLLDLPARLAATVELEEVAILPPAARAAVEALGAALGCHVLAYRARPPAASGPVRGRQFCQILLPAPLDAHDLRILERLEQSIDDVFLCCYARPIAIREEL